MKDDKWYRLHGIELPGSEESKSKNEDNLADLIANDLDKFHEMTQKARENQLIDELIDIYNGRYVSYGVYFEEKIRIRDICRKNNEENFKYNKYDNAVDVYQYSYMMEPYILTQSTFDYVMKKRGEKNNAN